MSILAAAIARLVQFRESWNEEDVIDKRSGLTARDLDCILAELEDPMTVPDPGCME